MKIPKDLHPHYTRNLKPKSKPQSSSFQRSVEHITSSSVLSIFNQHVVTESNNSGKSLKGRVSKSVKKPSSQDEP
jgi:hypothetical protein